jgi:hypothetical protein
MVRAQNIMSNPNPRRNTANQVREAHQNTQVKPLVRKNGGTGGASSSGVDSQNKGG